MLLVVVVYFWSTYVWLAALVLFISVVTAINHELAAFNEHKLMKVIEKVLRHLRTIDRKLRKSDRIQLFHIPFDSPHQELS